MGWQNHSVIRSELHLPHKLTPLPHTHSLGLLLDLGELKANCGRGKSTGWSGEAGQACCQPPRTAWILEGTSSLAPPTQATGRLCTRWPRPSRPSCKPPASPPGSWTMPRAYRSRERCAPAGQLQCSCCTPAALGQDATCPTQRLTDRLCTQASPVIHPLAGLRQSWRFG